jgi:hypothetical protein
MRRCKGDATRLSGAPSASRTDSNPHASERRSVRHRCRLFDHANASPCKSVLDLIMPFHFNARSHALSNLTCGRV